MDFDEDELWVDPKGVLRSATQIRDDDEILIFGDRRKPRTEIDEEIEEMLAETMLRSSPIVGPLIRRADSVFRYIWELLPMTPAQQRKAVRRPPYRDLLLASVLLEESAKWRSKRPEQSEQMAALAEWIAAQPWPEDRERAILIRARAFIAQADALCVVRDWQGAELRFGAAFSILDDLPAGLDHIFFCRQLSKLREDQGRLYEAAVLFLQAIQLECLFWDVKRPPREAFVHLAYLSLKQNDPGRAMSLLTQLCMEDEKETPLGGRTVSIDLGRAICLAAVGLAEPARCLTEESLAARRRILDRETRLPYEWLECRIAVHLGDLDRVIPKLEAVRRWLIHHGELDEVCLISIDLALAYAKQGQAAERLPGLLRDIAQQPGAGEHPWALGALWWFREAIERGQAPAGVAWEAAEIVHRREKSLVKLTAGRMSATRLADP